MLNFISGFSLVPRPFEGEEKGQQWKCIILIGLVPRPYRQYLGLWLTTTEKPSLVHCVKKVIVFWKAL
jgi:hypothetical protein